MQKKLFISYILIESIMGLIISHNSEAISKNWFSQIGSIQADVHVQSVMKALQNQKLTNIIWNSKQKINQPVLLPFVINQVIESPYFINQLVKAKDDWPLKLSEIYENIRKQIKESSFYIRGQKHQKRQHQKSWKHVAERRRSEVKEVKQKKKQSRKSMTEDYHRDDSQISDEMKEVLSGLTLEQSERLLELEVEEDD